MDFRSFFVIVRLKIILIKRFVYYIFVLYSYLKGGDKMIKNEVIEWIREQPYWWQVIANSIFRGKKLNDEDLDKIYIIFKQEVKLTQESLKKDDLKFTALDVISENTNNMKWNSVSNIKGVNALKDREILHIGKQVTLVYGKNGSGKSGYTRLLNNAFVSRGDKNILGNIFKNNKEDPSAIFDFKDADNNIESVLFPEDSNNTFLNSVSVFDTVSAVNVLTKESELDFAPMEFKFFDEFTQIFLIIKNKLVVEIESKQQNNDFGNYFDKNTIIKERVQKINGHSDYNEIKLLSDTSRMDEIYKENIKRKNVLLSLNIDEKLKEYKKLKQGLSQTKEKLELFNNKYSIQRIMKTEELLAERANLKKISSYEGLEQLAGEHIHKLGSPEWKNFILSSKTYYNLIDKEIKNCIFCGQSIENITVIEKYWKYLKSSAEKNLVRAEDNIKKLKADFESQNFNLVVKGSKVEDWLKENQSNLYEQLNDAEKNFRNVNLRIVESLSTLEWNQAVESYNVNSSCFNDVFELITRKINKLDADKVNKEVTILNNYFDEYDAKLKLEKHLPKIKNFINNAKWVSSAEMVNLSTQKITTFQNKLFSKYVSSKYIEKFDRECKQLNANFSAEIIQRGRKGVTLSRLSIKGKKPVEILSEGEQRSIALANFLAETDSNSNNVCLVFDDPVSSLDYERRDIIARRLVEEAKNKQVVILTHDITFLLILQNYCSISDIECRTTTIRKLGGSAGIIQEETIPWISMPVSKRIKKLRSDLQSITTFYKNINSNNIELMEEYEGKAKSWCELLRETWERTVEEVLFNNSVQRFSPAVETQRLKKAVFTKELYDELEKEMSSCSDWVHDRASGLGEMTPSPEELSEYLKTCDEFIKKNKP